MDKVSVEIPLKFMSTDTSVNALESPYQRIKLRGDRILSGDVQVVQMHGLLHHASLSLEVTFDFYFQDMHPETFKVLPKMHLRAFMEFRLEEGNGAL